MSDDVSHVAVNKGAQSRRPGAILIAGPTASGKSALALRLAQRLGGRIINADSMQVYRDLRILTARPTEAETAQTPHRLYGTVDGAEAYSVSRWLADARAEIEHAQADGVLPILVGGTGLYFKALTQGLSDIPGIPANVRVRLREWAAGKLPEALHDELARRDPAAAQCLRPTDPQRILRALEVHAATGESIVAFQQRRGPAAVPVKSAVAVTLRVDRAALARQIARRAQAMFATEAIAEVDRLASRHLDPALPVMRAIGVPQAMRYRAGDIALDAAIAETSLASRQYVKRQETFFCHQLPDFPLVDRDAAEAFVLDGSQS